MYYQELINNYSKSGQELKARNLLLFAKTSLKKEEYSSILIFFKQRFNKIYLRREFSYVPIYSNNFNSGIDSEYINVFNFPFKITEESKPKNSAGIRVNANLITYLPNKMGAEDKLTLNLNQTDFPASAGDIGIYSINYEKRIYKDYLTATSAKVRIAGRDYLDISSLGYKMKLKKTYFLFSIDEQNYKNSFQSGDGVKFVFFSNSKLINKIEMQRYFANEDTYSFLQMGMSTKMINIFDFLAAQLKIEKNIYKDKFEAFNKRRHGQNFYLNLFSKDYFGYTFKIGITERHSNIDIFETKSINLEFIKR